MINEFSNFELEKCLDSLNTPFLSYLLGKVLDVRQPFFAKMERQYRWPVLLMLALWRNNQEPGWRKRNHLMKSRMTLKTD